MPQNFQLGRLPRALLKGDKSKDENNFKPGVWYTVDPFDSKTWPPMKVRILIERKGFSYSPCFAIRMTKTMYGLALYPKARFRPVAEITRFQVAPVSRSDMMAKRKMEMLELVYGSR